MREIINCFFHCIEDTEQGYKYSFAVADENGIKVRTLTTGHLETQPIFQEVALPLEVRPQGENIKKWFKQQISTDII